MVQQVLGPITEASRPARYRTHLYWTRKPPDLAASYVKNFTKPGETVLDPFCGSGVIPIEAARLGRAGIGCDIDPVGLFIARMTATITNLSRIKKVFESFLQKIQSSIEPLYRTSCSFCGSTAAVTKVAVWIRKKNAPIEIRGACHKCGIFNKPPNSKDQANLDRIQAKSNQSHVPEELLRYDNGRPFLKSEGHTSIKDLYTSRNLTALGIIREQIETIIPQIDRNLLLFGFSSILHLASKLTPDRKSRPYSSHWGRPSFWIPPRSQERNVFELIQNALIGRQGVLKGLIDSKNNLNNTIIATSLEKLGAGSMFLKQISALRLSKFFPPKSVDMVFTDPPYGGAVQYFELNSIWAAWLGFKRDPIDEIIINSRQGKDRETFGEMLGCAFKEIFTLLKPGKKMILTFHTTDLRVWNLMVRGAIIAGFDLEHLFYQKSRRLSFKALAQPLNAAVGDYVFQFVRQKQKCDPITTTGFSDNSFSEAVKETAIKTIKVLGRPCTFTELLAAIYPEITEPRFLFSDNLDSLQSTLKSCLGKELFLVRSLDPISNKKADLWWTETEYRDVNYDYSLRRE